MRFFIRKAKMKDGALRETFERYGTVGMQLALGDMNHFVHQNKTMKADAVLDSLLPWLTEQYDRDERRETWHIIMEAAITVVLLVELFFQLPLCNLRPLVGQLWRLL